PSVSQSGGSQLVQLPAALAGSLKVDSGWNVLTDALSKQLSSLGTDPSSLPHLTTLFNLPAVIIVFIVTALLVVGIKESATFNNLIVFIKIAVVLLFIVGAVHALNPANWHPFIPPNTGKFGEFGWSGVMRGAS